MLIVARADTRQDLLPMPREARALKLATSEFLERSTYSAADLSQAVGLSRDQLRVLGDYGWNMLLDHLAQTI